MAKRIYLLVVATAAVVAAAATSNATQIKKNLNPQNTTVVFDHPQLGVDISAANLTFLHDATTITCPSNNDRKCTLVVEQSIQIGFFNATDIVMCFKLDGNFKDICPTATYPATGNWTFLTFTHSLDQIAPGQHTVRSHIQSSAAAKRGFFSIQYHMFQ